MGRKMYIIISSSDYRRESFHNCLRITENESDRCEKDKGNMPKGWQEYGQKNVN